MCSSPSLPYAGKLRTPTPLVWMPTSDARHTARWQHHRLHLRRPANPSEAAARLAHTKLAAAGMLSVRRRSAARAVSAGMGCHVLAWRRTGRRAVGRRQHGSVWGERRTATNGAKPPAVSAHR